MGHLRAAVTVGGGLRVRMDLDSLEMLGNSRSWRHTEDMKPQTSSRGTERRTVAPPAVVQEGIVQVVLLLVMEDSGEGSSGSEGFTKV